MDIVVFTHLPPYRQFFPRRGDFEMLAESAQHEGLRTMQLPYRADNFDDILSYLPDFENAYGIYNGGVVSAAFYEKLYHAALGKGITFLNNSIENERVMHFNKFYPLIADLTAKSVVLENPTDIESAEQAIGYPMFVKGQIKSNKEEGWDACVAADRQTLEKLVAKWPMVIAREILPLRQNGSAHLNFPTSREYRIYLYQGDLIGMGYYWEGADPFGPLTAEDKAQVMGLSNQAATRLSAPLTAVDVGQLETGEWRIIEVGDPQHSGIAHMPKHLYWRCLDKLLS